MIPHNDYDKLSIVKLFAIIKILQQQSGFNEKLNLTSSKNSSNIKHKNNLDHNNLSFKKNSKGKINTECNPPIKEDNLVDDIKYVPSIQKVNIKDDTKYISFIQEINIEYDTNCIKKNIQNKDEIIPENISANYDENTISTLPIIIIEKNIDIPIESTLILKNDTLDIKNIRKHIYLSSSNVLIIYQN